ncbi:unannotated protein [freshwater metagenome]|uniref:Unannotated protein n=1 Tax=freshwater metagenome TaxID=449393 RepID=A0A6J7CI50_9ZZZZ|nr:TetR family transcriptional regulator [Actinomycetota bacterium]
MKVTTRRRPGRPLGGQHVVDRDLVLDAAERAIRRDGPTVSLEAIAVEAGVTKPVVYARVGGRTEVANALAERLADRIMAAVTAAIAGKPIGRSTLVSFLTANLEVVAGHRELFLYVTGGTPDDTPQRTLQLARHSTGPLARVLASWREASGLDPAVSVPWAFAVIGMLHLSSLWWISDSDCSAAELAEQLSELLWSGLATGRPD